MPRIKIIKSGLLTTVQDMGRYGYQQYGMAVAGAMDTYSLSLANYLVGNSPNEACLEVTAIGPEIEFDSVTCIAVCGADMHAVLNGNKIERYETIRVKAGDKLWLKDAQQGFRSYIAFAGGIDVPVVMGSKSTYLRGGLGGYKGRQLKAGDELVLGNCSKYQEERKIPEKQIPKYGNHYTARVIAGPESDSFTVNGLVKFLNSKYCLTSQCDRMGYRLEGEKIEHKKTADIVSSGIAFGTIQVPAHGQPIIMMADRQTSGGYTRIANVISEGLPYLAQLKPGDTVSFEEVRLSNL